MRRLSGAQIFPRISEYILLVAVPLHLPMKPCYLMINTAHGRARVLAGRIVSPVDEALIPPGVIRPAGSRALPDDRHGRGKAMLT